PWAVVVATPPGADWSYFETLGYTPEQLYEFALQSLETKLKWLGISPAEISSLALLGDPNSPKLQAARLVSLIEARILGTDEEPQVDEQTLDTLFGALQSLARSRQPRYPNVRGSIQWIFTDQLQPRYLALSSAQDSPYTGTGLLDRPQLTL